MKDFKFKINGNDYKVEISEVVSNVAQVLVNGVQYTVEMEKESEPLVPVRKVQPKVHFEAPTVSVNKGGSGKPIKSPLPGVILDIKVKEGDAVKKGQTVLVMEAMKMENNIAAESDGTIAAIKVKQGQAVLQGDVLVEIS
jgi:biotin carboxyl carrier protein